MKEAGLLPEKTKLRSSKYLNNIIGQDHRSVKGRLAPMLGLKRFQNTKLVIAGVEFMHRIRKGQFALTKLQMQGQVAPAVWEAVLAACWRQ